MAEQSQYVPYTSNEERANVFPLVVGALISFTFFGIGLVQFFFCFDRLHGRNSPQDTIAFRYLIVLFVSDIIDTVCKGQFIVDHLHNVIVGGVLGSITLPPVTFSIPTTEGFLTCLSHSVYIYRIMKLTPGRGPKTWTILLFCMVVSVVQFAFAIYTATWCFKPFNTWMPTMKPPLIVWVGGAALVDVLLCTLFVYYLRRHKSNVKETNNLITRYTLLSLETGLLPSALQILTLLLGIIVPQTPDVVVAALFLPKIYVNAVLIVISTVLRDRDNNNGVFSGTLDVTRTEGGLASVWKSKLFASRIDAPATTHNEKKTRVNVTQTLQVHTEITQQDDHIVELGHVSHLHKKSSGGISTDGDGHGFD